MSFVTLFSSKNKLIQFTIIKKEKRGEREREREKTSETHRNFDDNTIGTIGKI
jgi:hypothetical protein